MAEFKRGDVVYLNSGSPPLTVLGIDADGMVRVCWRGNIDLNFSEFRAECLTSDVRLN